MEDVLGRNLIGIPRFALAQNQNAPSQVILVGQHIHDISVLESELNALVFGQQTFQGFIVLLSELGDSPQLENDKINQSFRMQIAYLIDLGKDLWKKDFFYYMIIFLEKNFYGGFSQKRNRRTTP